jgi:hypothetical protein
MIKKKFLASSAKNNLKIDINLVCEIRSMETAQRRCSESRQPFAKRSPESESTCIYHLSEHKGVINRLFIYKIKSK